MECPRKYAYDYYVSHNGWLNYDVHPLSKQAYRLKKLLTLPILFGQITHEIADMIIKAFLTKKYIPTIDELIQIGRNKLNQAYLDSRDRYDYWYEKPNHYKMLFEMYYDGELDQEKVVDYRERLRIVLTNLIKSKTYQDITRRHHTMRFNQSEEFRYLIVDDVKVFVVLDLLYRDIEQGKWIIVDWKTGKESDDDRNQLALYALYLRKTFNVDVHDIEVRNEYLLTGTQKNYIVNENDIERVYKQIRSSIHLMKKYQMDILTNEPVPLENFEQTEYLNRCIRCNYKELCKRID